MAFYQGGYVGVRLSYLVATAILVIFIVSIGANVVHVNAGQPHPLSVGPPPAGCIEGQASVWEWCPGQEYKTWKRAMVCHNGVQVLETQDCPTETQTETQTQSTQCGAEEAPKVTEWCPGGTGWKTRQICKNGEWQQETNPQPCPQCNAGDPPRNVVNCKIDPKKWNTREVCTNGAWQRETNPERCPECKPNELNCIRTCNYLLKEPECEYGYFCSGGFWTPYMKHCFGACYIATATYGSELSPEVQLLRNFRDRDVLQTYAGGEGMKVFNLIYYSFSPQVAQTISSNENLRTVMRYVLYPLIGILWVSQQLHTALAFSPEGAIVVAGVLTGSMIGLLYALPFYGLSVAVSRAFRKKLTFKHVSLSLVLLATASTLIVISEVTRFDLLMQLSTSLLALTSAALPGITLSAWALNRHR